MRNASKLLENNIQNEHVYSYLSCCDVLIFVLLFIHLCLKTKKL